jgi:hypothetical protein
LSKARDKLATLDTIRDIFFQKVLAFRLKATTFLRQGLIFADVAQFRLALRSIVRAIDITAVDIAAERGER